MNSITLHTPTLKLSRGAARKVSHNFMASHNIDGFTEFVRATLHRGLHMIPLCRTGPLVIAELARLIGVLVPAMVRVELLLILTVNKE